MVLARRTLAVPIFIVGGAIWLAAFLATIAAGCWYTYVGVKLVVEDGAILEGVLVATFAPTIAMGIVSLRSLRTASGLQQHIASKHS
jgi:hypothetical protein